MFQLHGCAFSLLHYPKDLLKTLLQTRFIASAESTVTSVMPDFTCCYVFFFSISKSANSTVVMFVIDTTTAVLKGALQSGMTTFLTPFFPLSSLRGVLIVNPLGLMAAHLDAKMDANSELYRFQYVMCMCADDDKQKPDHCSDQHVARPFLQGWIQASIYATFNWCFFFFQGEPFVRP